MTDVYSWVTFTAGGGTNYCFAVDEVVSLTG